MDSISDINTWPPFNHDHSTVPCDLHLLPTPNAMVNQPSSSQEADWQALVNELENGNGLTAEDLALFNCNNSHSAAFPRPSIEVFDEQNDYYFLHHEADQTSVDTKSSPADTCNMWPPMPSPPVSNHDLVSAGYAHDNQGQTFDGPVSVSVEDVQDDNLPFYQSYIQVPQPHMATPLLDSSPYLSDMIDDQASTHSPAEFNDYSDGESADPCYAQLLYRCLSETPGHTMSLRELYEWVAANSSKAKDPKNRGWQNSVRHNLSMNAAFERVPAATGSNKKGSLWRLTEQALHNGVISTTRYRKDPKRRSDRRGEPAPSRQRSGAKGGQATRAATRRMQRERSMPYRPGRSSDYDNTSPMLHPSRHHPHHTPSASQTPNFLPQLPPSNPPSPYFIDHLPSASPQPFYSPHIGAGLPVTSYSQTPPQLHLFYDENDVRGYPKPPSAFQPYHPNTPAFNPHGSVRSQPLQHPPLETNNIPSPLLLPGPIALPPTSAYHSVPSFSPTSAYGGPSQSSYGPTSTSTYHGSISSSYGGPVSATTSSTSNGRSSPYYNGDLPDSAFSNGSGPFGPSFVVSVSPTSHAFQGHGNRVVSPPAYSNNFPSVAAAHDSNHNFPLPSGPTRSFPLQNMDFQHHPHHASFSNTTTRPRSTSLSHDSKPHSFSHAFPTGPRVRNISTSSIPPPSTTSSSFSRRPSLTQSQPPSETQPPIQSQLQAPQPTNPGTTNNRALRGSHAAASLFLKAQHAQPQEPGAAIAEDTNQQHHPPGSSFRSFQPHVDTAQDATFIQGEWQ